MLKVRIIKQQINTYILYKLADQMITEQHHKDMSNITIIERLC